MTRWQFCLGPPGGGVDYALPDARDRKLTAKLTEPDVASCSHDGRSEVLTHLDELASDLHVLFTPDGGQAEWLFRGRVGNCDDEIDADRHTVSIPALDYREVLNRRILYSDSTLAWSGMDQAEIAWRLLFQSQGRKAGADLGITPGVGSTIGHADGDFGDSTGVDRDREYEAGDSIGERIQELSEVLDGFDWAITPVDQSVLHFDVFYPQRGTDRGVILERGGRASTIKRTPDVGDYANAVRVTGREDDDGNEPTPVELEAGDVATVAQGRWDAAIGEDITTQVALAERAAWQLANRQVVPVSYTVTLSQDPKLRWQGPLDIWLGDPVRIVAYSRPRLAVDTTLRVQQIEITIPDTGLEQVTLTLGAPPPNPRRWPKRVERRLSRLETR